MHLGLCFLAGGRGGWRGEVDKAATSAEMVFLTCHFSRSNYSALSLNEIRTLSHDCE